MHKTAYYYSVEHASGSTIIVRTERAFETIAVLRQAHKQLFQDIGDHFLNTPLVWDLRLVKGRNDKAFEEAMLEFRQNVDKSSKKTIVVVATELGRLQVQRYSRIDGHVLTVVTSIDEAIEECGKA